jgi:hypothetical protein
MEKLHDSRVGREIDTELLERIQGAVDELSLLADEAVYVLDGEGWLLASGGRYPDTDELQPLGVHLGAQWRTARDDWPEKVDFVAEGDRASAYLRSLDGEIVLVWVFGREQPVGFVRVRARRLLETLRSMVRETPGEPLVPEQPGVSVAPVLWDVMHKNSLH